MSQLNPKVGFVSLGCPKALVDSERILTQLRVEGYDIVPSYDAADVVVVNTCGFIDSAVTESLDAIGEAMNANGKVIVTGCLGKRPEQIREAYPQVLAVSGPQDYQSVMEAVHAALPPRHDPFVDLVPDYGIKLTPRPDRIVAAPRGAGDAFLSLTVPMAISNALVLTIARRAPERALGALDRLGVLLEHFDA